MTDIARNNRCRTPTEWTCVFLVFFWVAYVVSPGQALDLQRVRLENGVELAVQKNGDGPVPIILIHGYSMSMMTWDNVVPLFPTDKYTTYAYDLRGFGDSTKPAGGFNYRQDVEDLHELLKALKLTRAVIVGHSIGGQIAQEFVIRYPNEVVALVTSGSLARSLPPAGYTDAIRARVDSYGTPEQNRKVFEVAIPRYFDQRNVTIEDIRRFVAVAMKSSTTALREQLIDIFSTPALDAAQFQEIKSPVLVISSSTDPIGTISQAIALTDAIPNSELAVIERAGHTSMWERPDAWMRRVIPFFDRSLKQR